MRKIVRSKPVFCGWLECSEFIKPGEAYLIKDSVPKKRNLWHAYHYGTPAFPDRTPSEKIMLVYNQKLPQNIRAYQEELDLKDIEKRKSIIPLERIASRISPKLAFEMYKTISYLFENLDSKEVVFKLEEKVNTINKIDLEIIAYEYQEIVTEDKTSFHRHLLDNELKSLEEVGSKIKLRSGRKKMYEAIINLLFADEKNKVDVGCADIYRLVKKYAKQSRIRI
jgi:hypothetical protein